MLEKDQILQELAISRALPVYQLAILDFLNRAGSPQDIAGTEPQEGPVADDPGRKGRGYDIGITVAGRILERRKALGGTFTSLDQLAEIPYFGVDKFHDLVYTFTQLRTPLPTGLGADFDKFILALGTLELNAQGRGMSRPDTLSAIRKVFFDDELPKKGKEPLGKLNWDKVVPSAEGVGVPAEWSVRKDLQEAVKVLQEEALVKAGSGMVDMQVLLGALDARLRPAEVKSGNTKLQFKSNREFATFPLSLGNTIFQFLKGKDIKPGDKPDLDQEVLDANYSQANSSVAMAAQADSYSMEYEKDMSVTWNLLNYYTDTEAAVKTRYQGFAEGIGLGKVEEGKFSGDSKAFREEFIEKAQNTAFFALIENDKGELVQRMLSGSLEDGSFIAYRSSAAYVANRYLDRLLILVGTEAKRPYIIAWNRLEARPRKEDFTRTLRAEVRDALWMLSRQWQLGEFKGEDTGSATEMRVQMQSTSVNRFALRKGEARPYDPDIPMETVVEREFVDADLSLRQEMGRHFERLLITKLESLAVPPATRSAIRQDLRDVGEFRFQVPLPGDEHPDVHSDPALLRSYAALGGGRALDGHALYTSVKAGTNASSHVAASSDAAILAEVDAVAQELITWFERIFNQPATTEDSAWNAAQLEYQFHCSAPAGSRNTTVLSTDEYANGHLDWYNFDFELDTGAYHPSLTSGPPDNSLVENRLITVFPASLTFPGMPHPRWWQFEDHKIDIGSIKANTTETPKILLAEFALIYSNDWMLLPYTVKVGSLSEIQSLVVRDVFGQYTSVRSAGAGDNSDWQRWSMYTLNRRNLTSGVADTRLFVPPAVVRTMESEPVEKVGLLRDEMANMVWGIEMKIPDGRGGNQDGWDASRKLYDYLVSITPEQPPPNPPVPNDAEISYQLGTTVPEHWIPFIPVRKGGVNSRQIQLRRAAMPRLIPGRIPERIRPRTELLKTGYDPNTDTWGPYFLFEEEVPRSGTIVTRTWQRTRWMNGQPYTWLGRRVSNGRGEANSGLEFDTVS